MQANPLLTSKTSYCIFVILICRLYLFFTAPVDTIFRHHILPVYLIYTTVVSFVLAIAITLTDGEVVLRHLLVVSTGFALYDAGFHIYQSLFNVFVRTGIAVLFTVLVERFTKKLLRCIRVIRQ